MIQPRQMFQICTAVQKDKIVPIPMKNKEAHLCMSKVVSYPKPATDSLMPQCKCFKIQTIF